MLLPALLGTMAYAGMPLWSDHGGKNCFEAHGGQVLDCGRSIGVMTLAACQAKCVELPGCSAVTYHDFAANNVGGFVNVLFVAS